MDLVLHSILSTVDSSHNSSKLSWAVTGYKFRLSNKSLSMLESFKVVNLLKNDAQLSYTCVVLTDSICRHCPYKVLNTTSGAHKI